MITMTLGLGLLLEFFVSIPALAVLVCPAYENTHPPVTIADEATPNALKKSLLFICYS
jgi:hypothetical protein